MIYSPFQPAYLSCQSLSHLRHHAAPRDQINIQLRSFLTLVGDDRVEEAIEMVIVAVIELAKCVKAFAQVDWQERRIVVANA